MAIGAKLSVGDLERNKDSSSVWVTNNSNPKGNINLTMNDGMGANMVVRIPVTFIPVDLATQASKAALVASPTFRRLVSMGMLVIISDDDANRVMSTPQAQKEAARIYNLVQELTTDASSMPEEAVKLQREGDGSVSGFAMNLVIAAGLDEDQVMTTLLGNESAMSESDFAYIAERSEFLRVKAYCAEHLLNK